MGIICVRRVLWKNELDGQTLGSSLLLRHRRLWMTPPHRWGTEWRKGCVILKYAIFVDKGFKSCYKFIFITEHPPNLLQKNPQLCHLQLLYCNGGGSWLFWGNIELFKDNGSLLWGNKREGGINYTLLFIREITFII